MRPKLMSWKDVSKYIYYSDVLIVDLRDPGEYKKGHIRGAWNIPYAKQVKTNKRMPDYDYIRKELLRNGVSKKLLWTEYMEECRTNGDEPLMYSQFCYHIQ